jgi:putative ABC transport system permease protein
LPFVIDVEAYREGKAVPNRNWAGGSAAPYLSFDGVLVVAPTGLDTVTARSLTIGTGFSAVEPVAAHAFLERTGLALPEGFQVYDVHVLREPAQWSAVKNVRDKLRGRGIALLPYVRESALTLKAAAGAPMTVKVFGLSPSPQERALLRLPELPWGALKPDAAFADYAQALLPPGTLSPAAETVTASLANATAAPSFPLRYSGQSFTGYGIVPVELLAVLRTGAVRPMTFSAEQQSFLLARTGYSGFRLYARSIDDVTGLHRELREQGIETIAKIQDIERVRMLDRGLTRLFWLVAVVGITGGIAALIASLYAAVERKKRDISMLRLMGLSRLAVTRFPVYQSAMVAILATGFAVIGFYTLAMVINTVFAADLGRAERICQLPAIKLVLALLITVAVAVLSSLLAAWRTNRIEPAEAIRVE